MTMTRKLTLAALVLTLGLAAAGCGSTADAGAAASRWDETGDGKAIQIQNEARGPLSDGYYSADAEGRVAGFDDRTPEKRSDLSKAGREMKRAGKDMLRGARDAAKNAGDMAEKAVNDAGGVSETDRDRADHIFDPSRN